MHPLFNAIFQLNSIHSLPDTRLHEPFSLSCNSVFKFVQTYLINTVYALHTHMAYVSPDTVRQVTSDLTQPFVSQFSRLKTGKLAWFQVLNLSYFLCLDSSGPVLHTFPFSIFCTISALSRPCGGRSTTGRHLNGQTRLP